MFKIKITGLDNLTRQFDDAQKALAALDGTLGTVKFNPDDPASIEAAIQTIVVIIDERVGDYAANPIIDSLVEQMKEKYRDAIIERASTARLTEKTD